MSIMMVSKQMSNLRSTYNNLVHRSFFRKPLWFESIWHVSGRQKPAFPITQLSLSPYLSFVFSSMVQRLRAHFTPLISVHRPHGIPYGLEIIQQYGYLQCIKNVHSKPIIIKHWSEMCGLHDHIFSTVHIKVRHIKQCLNILSNTQIMH